MKTNLHPYQTETKQRSFRRMAGLFGVGIVIGIAWMAWNCKPGPQPDLARIVGDWQRPDGGYLLRISAVEPDGKLQALYFNPNPIHVAGATASVQNSAVKLFVELRDVGYPGSKYDLVYNPGANRLEGTYFQAQEQQLYSVVFQRIN